MASWSFNERALSALVNESPAGKALLAKAATQVRDRARANASWASPEHTSAITYEMGKDEQGPYADVGYMKHHPGFFLWWWEVGTKNHRARPHLRPAVKPESL